MSFQLPYAYGLTISVETLVTSMKNFMDYRPFHEEINNGIVIYKNETNDLKQALSEASNKIIDMINYIDEFNNSRPLRPLDD